MHTATAHENRPVGPATSRRICVLVIHGIGQQRRGECASALAGSVYRAFCKSPWCRSLGPLEIKCSKSQPHLEKTMLLASGTHGMVQLEFRECFWGPLACSRVSLLHLALWFARAIAILVVRCATGRVNVSTLVDTAHLLAWIFGMAGLMVAPVGLFGPSLMAVCLSGAFVLLASWFLQHYVCDVVRYFCTSEYDPNHRIRRRIQRHGVRMFRRAVNASSGYDEVIVVAHSLGTVILLDCLRLAFARTAPRNWNRLSTIITLGSPIAKCETLRLGDKWLSISVSRALAGKRWLNFYFPTDPVADQVQFPGSCITGMNHALPRGIPLLCHTTYWRHPAVPDAILHAITSTPSSHCRLAMAHLPVAVTTIELRRSADERRHGNGVLRARPQDQAAPPNQATLVASAVVHFAACADLPAPASGVCAGTGGDN